MYCTENVTISEGNVTLMTLNFLPSDEYTSADHIAFVVSNIQIEVLHLHSQTLAFCCIVFL